MTAQRILKTGAILITSACLWMTVSDGNAASSSSEPAEATLRSGAVRRAVAAGENVWLAASDPDRLNPRASEMFGYALALCEANTQFDRLEKLFETAARMQILDPQRPSYGNFRWNWLDQDVRDQNAVDFAMQPASIIWLKHRDRLPAAARARLAAILDAAVKGSVAHRVSDGYTNIALMSASNLILLGEGMGREDILAEGCARLDAMFTLTLKSGIREYVSPDYYGIDLSALQLLDTYARHPVARRQAHALLELFWTDVAANFWWQNRRLCGAHSRGYDYLHSIGGLDAHLAAAGYIETAAAPALIPAIVDWRPSAGLKELSQRLPRRVRQIWGKATTAEVPTPGSPVIQGTLAGTVWAGFTHWLAEDVTLSIAGANYGPIDTPLAVDLPGTRDSVRCFFIPDGRHDPYGKSKIPWRGHPKAVHLQPFFAGVQETQDALALVMYRDKDVPEECKSLESHIVMPLDVDAVYVGERKVNFRRGHPETFAVASGQPVFLRKGTAAVGVRVPVARTRAGEPAPIVLAWDDNEWGAIRVSVDHQLGKSRKTVPAAAFHVRVGSKLDDAGFARFRSDFAAAAAAVRVEPEHIEVKVAGLKSPGVLEIAAAAPWNSPVRMSPALPPVVLEIDGQDVGRALLEGARPQAAAIPSK